MRAHRLGAIDLSYRVMERGGRPHQVGPRSLNNKHVRFAQMQERNSGDALPGVRSIGLLRLMIQPLRAPRNTNVSSA